MEFGDEGEERDVTWIFVSREETQKGERNDCRVPE